MKLAFYRRKFNVLSEYIYFYWEIVNSFEVISKNPTCGSKIQCIIKVDSYTFALMSPFQKREFFNVIPHPEITTQL